jgi:hypothetical protein
LPENARFSQDALKGVPFFGVTAKAAKGAKFLKIVLRS